MFIHGLIWTSIPHVLCRQCALNRLREHDRYRQNRGDNQNFLNYANRLHRRYQESLDDSDNVYCVYDTDEGFEDYVCDECLQSLGG